MIPMPCVPSCGPTTRQDRVKYLQGLLEKHESQNMTYNMVRHARTTVPFFLTVGLYVNLRPILLFLSRLAVRHA